MFNMDIQHHSSTWIKKNKTKHKKQNMSPLRLERVILKDRKWNGLCLTERCWASVKSISLCLIALMQWVRDYYRTCKAEGGLRGLAFLTPLPIICYKKVQQNMREEPEPLSNLLHLSGPAMGMQVTELPVLWLDCHWSIRFKFKNRVTQHHTLWEL